MTSRPTTAEGSVTGFHSSDRIWPLRNVIRDYPWGSRTVIPDLLGVAPGDAPAAELWMGAHPGAPSVLADEPDETLADLIAADPSGELGADIAERFHQRLPFLLKVLAAEHPLSLQAHPSRAQAREGFARDNAAGLADDDPHRNYRDANHKPEQLVALSEFEGVCGFRPVELTAQFLDHLAAPSSDHAGGDLPLLAGYRQRLVAEGGLRDVVTAVLTAPAEHVTALIEEVVPAAVRVADAASDWAPEAGWIVVLADEHPGDRGVIMALLLNLVRLAPGESMFLGAGQIHTYLRGAGVEIMANSDNVLRGGLTGKHVDVPELMRVLDVREQLVRPVLPSDDGAGAGVAWYPSSVPDFVLGRLRPTEPISLPAGSPRILLCTDGAARVEAGARSIILARGRSAFLPAATAATVHPVPDGPTPTVFLARVNAEVPPAR